MTDTQDDFEKLSRIPSPIAASETPDDPTQLELADARRHPVVLIILYVLGGIGLLLVLVSITTHHREAVDSEEVQSLIPVDDLIQGLGVEILASVLMVHLLFSHLSSKDQAVQTRWCLGIMAVGIALTIGPYLMSAKFYGALLIAFGVEVIGAVVIFALLDNVVEVIQSKGK